jgi:hypothetical protein
MSAVTVLTICLVAFASSGHLSAAAELKVGNTATSAEDMAAKLHELGVSMRSQ